MKYLTNGATDPHYNMAFDEFCLERLESDAPVFYLWQNRPAVIIGLNQSAYAEVNLAYLEQKGILLARRVTGGGAVYHDLQNLNYTITGRSSDLERDYPEYLELIVGALRKLGADACLSGRNDILVDGRKCSGFAKRVYKDRLMVHGTLMFDVDLEDLTAALAVPGSKLSAAGVASVRSRVANLREFLPGIKDIKEFQARLQEILQGSDTELVLTEAELASVEKDAAEKFRTWDWIYGRSPEADFKSSAKLPCGTVEVRWSVRRGCLQDVAFGGDFLGNLPAEGLAMTLNGSRFDRESVTAALAGSSVGDYFDNTSAAQLASLFF